MFLILLFMGCTAPASQTLTESRASKFKKLENQISKYSENDEIDAKRKMEIACEKSNVAVADDMDLMKKINVSLTNDIENKNPNSKETAQLFQELELRNATVKTSSLEAECKSASNDYSRILTVRENAANAAAKIIYDEEARDSERAATPIKSSMPVNCTSNIIGNTVYTHCN